MTPAAWGGAARIRELERPAGGLSGVMMRARSGTVIGIAPFLR